MENNLFTWNNAAITKTIRFLLSSFFGLREGEYKRAFLMQLNIFLIISTLLIVKPSVTGLFLARFGIEKLPLAFVLVALVAMGFSYFYSKKLVKISFYLLLRRTTGISVIILIVFGILLLFQILESWVIYLFYIWVALFAVLSASQFWILANLVFNVREAKRLFGFIGAGAIAGGIFGGYLTSILAPLIGSESLLFVSAFLLWLSIPITRVIWMENLSSKKNPFRNKNKIAEIVESPLQLILKSKHLTYLAGIIGLSVIVAKLVDFQFNAIASAKISDPDKLTAFFGFWFSNFNLLSLLIQLFITRRVVGVYGVGASLFFLPAGIFIGACLVLVAPSLFSAIIIKLTDGSLKQSINKSAVELLALPIPLAIKNKTKTFIDVFVDSFATGIGGLILIVIVNVFKLTVPFISLIIMAILLVWFYFALKIRTEYIKSFQQKLSQNAQNKKSMELNIASESVINGLIRVLENGTDSQIIWVLQKIREKPDERFFQAVLKLLQHNNGAVRAEALRTLHLYRNRPVPELVYPKISDPFQEVKIAAFEYLLQHHSENRVELMKQFLADPDYKISGAALLSLSGELRANPELKKQYELHRIVADKIEALKNENNAEIKEFNTKTILSAIGNGNLTGFYSFIEEALNSKNPSIKKQAVIAAGQTMDTFFIDKLIALLADKDQSKNAAAALAQYGVEIIHFLKAILKKDSNLEIQRKVPEILENIESQSAVSFLLELLDSADTVTRNNALLSLSTLKAKYPFLHFDKKMVINRILEEARTIQETLTILYIQTKLEKELKIDNHELDAARKSLIELLERRLDGGLERIFRLLGLRYPPDAIMSAFKSFQSNKSEVRISSIEYLDNLLDSRLKKVIIPILETSILDSLSEEVLKNMNVHIPDEKDCYALLLEGKDIKIKLAVLYLLSRKKDPKYYDLLEPYCNDSNPKVQFYAKQALQAITS